MYYNRVLSYSLISICILSIVGLSLSTAIQAVSSPMHTTTIVLDAGHGGIDGGCQGVNTGIYESKINLLYVKLLKSTLENSGYRIILTRDDMDGLYDPSAHNLKRSDMSKRKQIIESCNPDIVISIHMNSHTSSSCKGAQVFYNADNPASKYLSTCIQDKFADTLPYSKSTSKPGDFYMVNCTQVPSVLIECGYLSNPTEEKLLLDGDYQHMLVKCIVHGIIEYLK